MIDHAGMCNLYQRLDLPALRPLPATRFEPSLWGRAIVHEDYHVVVEGHRYSVPHSLVGEEIEWRLTAQTAEMFLRGKRVASHVRSNDGLHASTDPDHRPPHHHAWVQKDTGRLIAWAMEVGPWTETLMRRLLDPQTNFHPDVRWRSGLGLRRIGDQHGFERCERACQRALRYGGTSYLHVARILKHNLDERPLPEEVPEDDAPIEHDQVRGPGYYQ